MHARGKGMHGEVGVCVAKGAMCALGERGRGMCDERGGRAWQEKRAVRILLECILVIVEFPEFVLDVWIVRL